MSSRELSQCVPELRVIWPKLVTRCAIVGLEPIITCTSRSNLEQVALFAQGRQDLDIVNKLRLAVKLPKITEKQNKKVTWTMNSLHVITDKRPFSEAIDFALKYENGRIYWDLKENVNLDNVTDYLQVAMIGRDLGLECGAFFKESKDYPHMQIRRY